MKKWVAREKAPVTMYRLVRCYSAYGMRERQEAEYVRASRYNRPVVPMPEEEVLDRIYGTLSTAKGARTMILGSGYWSTMLRDVRIEACSPLWAPVPVT